MRFHFLSLLLIAGASLSEVFGRELSLEKNHAQDKISRKTERRVNELFQKYKGDKNVAAERKLVRTPKQAESPKAVDAAEESAFWDRLLQVGSVPTQAPAGLPTMFPGNMPSLPPAGLLPDLYDLAVQAGLTTLVALINQAGLEDALRGDGPLTVFGPTNDAFASFLGANPGAVKFIEPEYSAQLLDILLYHVYVGPFSPVELAGGPATGASPSGASPQASIPDGTMLQMLNGRVITVNFDGNTAVLTDDVGQSIIVAVPDQLASNGIAHLIDSSILVPGWAETSLTDVFSADPNFSILVDLLQTAGLDDTLDDPNGNFTIFAPTNQAFEDLLDDTGLTLDEVKQLPNLAEILLLHVLGAVVPASAVNEAGSITTNALNGDQVTVTGGNTIVYSVTGSNSANVLNGLDDILANNGVAHAVDTVLLPPTAPTTPIPTSPPSTPVPTPAPTPEPTPGPTFPNATPAPTPVPSPAPTPVPTPSPTPVPTPAPTPQATLSRAEQVVRDNALFGGQEFNDPESHQSQALAWISGTNADPYTDAQILERYGLACIFYATNQVFTVFANVTYGGRIPEWFDRNGWVTDTDHCTWDRVTCSETTRLVEELNLNANLMSGTMPAEIVYLSDSLKVWAMNDNPVFSDGDFFHEYLGMLTNLEELRLSKTAFSSTQGLPVELSKLTNLLGLEMAFTLYRGQLDPNVFSPTDPYVFIDITGNGFNQSPIPQAFGQMPDLRGLFIGENELTGTFDFLSTAPSLEAAFVDSNFLGGTLPANIASRDIVALSFEDNFFDGPLPANWETYDMVAIYASRNALTGNVPAGYGDMPLQQLFFELNGMTGETPETVCNIIFRNPDEHLVVGDCCICEVFSSGGCCTSCQETISDPDFCPFQVGEYQLPELP